MRIVVLDGHTMNPGDIGWDGLQALGECVIHDRTGADEIVPRMQGAEIAITNKVVFDRATIEALPQLRYIGVTATGYNIIDTVTAKERNVTVSNVPAYSTQSVAQHVFALLLELTNHTGLHNRAVREGEGRWAARKDFSFWEKPIIELAGLTMGIAGFGHIGRAVATLAHAFGMKVIATARTPRKAEGIEFCTLDDLFARADVVSLHCPLNAETKELVNEKRLTLMKRTSYLINTARGPLIDEAALAKALNETRLAGAGLDVLSSEPPLPSNPLLTASNCIITPHVAWASVAARKRLFDVVVANLQGFLNGQPANVVNRI